MTETGTGIRSAAVAGLFYPAGRDELARSVDAMLATAAATTAAPVVPKALIVPHAGYVYSGPIAARAYALLAPARDRIRRVVLLGPTHRAAVHGLALPGAAGFATPLGIVPVDEEAIDSLRGMPQVVVNPQAHALEHSLEVHLPFLQASLADFSIVPLAVGRASVTDVAAVLDRLWGGAETLIVVSSDLSHYLPYEQARALDAATARAILEHSTDISHDQACGATPVAGLALVARRRGLGTELIDLRNSGDTAGDRTRVVGYGSFAFHEGGSR